MSSREKFKLHGAVAVTTGKVKVNCTLAHQRFGAASGHASANYVCVLRYALETYRREISTPARLFQQYDIFFFSIQDVRKCSVTLTSAASGSADGPSVRMTMRFGTSMRSPAAEVSIDVRT